MQVTSITFGRSWPAFKTQTRSFGGRTSYAQCAECDRPIEQIASEVFQSGLIQVDWECVNCQAIRFFLARLEWKSAQTARALFWIEPVQYGFDLESTWPKLKFLF